MKQTSYLLAGTLAACLTFSGLHAETMVLIKSGSREAFGGTSDSGMSVCGISSSLEKKYFGLKQFGNRDTFTIQISDKSRSVTDKSKYSVTMRLDRDR